MYIFFCLSTVKKTRPSWFNLCRIVSEIEIEYEQSGICVLLWDYNNIVWSWKMQLTSPVFDDRIFRDIIIIQINLQHSVSIEKYFYGYSI